MTIKHFDVKLSKSEITIKEMTLKNPKGFRDQIMTQIPEIYLKYDPSAFLTKREIHFNNLRFRLDQLTVIRNEKGELNINALAALQPKGEGPPPKFKIDLLELEIGKVIYKDYSAEASAAVQEFTVGINEKYTNITNPQDLVKLIVLRALIKTPVANLADFNINQLKESLSTTIETVGQNAIKKLFETLDEKLKQIP